MKEGERVERRNSSKILSDGYKMRLWSNL